MKDTSWLWVLSPIAILLIAIVGATFRMGSWKCGVDKGIKSLHKTTKRLEKKIDAILMPAFSSSSPLRLTEFGERLSKEIEAKEWAVAFAPSLIEKYEGKLAYDMQEICIEYAKAGLQSSSLLKKSC